MYLGKLTEWFSDAFDAVGNAIKHIFYQVTHDPVWGGGAIALVAVIVLLFVLKKKSAG